jgi:FKBP-type peptidyl-prolyl cis-trans isomerase
MRRASALIVVPILAAFAAVGCGSSTSASANQSVTATGSFGSAPKVSIPAESAGTDLTVKKLIHGNGAKLTSSDSFVGNYAAYVWSGTTHKLATSTYSASPALFTGKLLTGLQDALNGATVGSRVLAVIPPKDGFGSTGNSSLGIKGTDTLVFIVDVVKKFKNTAGATGTHVSNGGGALPTVSAAATNPTITVQTKNKPPTALTTHVLVKGSGPALEKGQLAVVQYTGVIWRTGKVFDSSWTRSEPFAFTLQASTEQVIPGWDKGLAGQTVGSRVMLVIPPKDGYGSSGASSAGIKGTDTLVFVVDILGAVK